MSTNVGEIDLSLILNSDKFNSQLKNVDAQANTASSKISASLSKIGKAVAVAFSVTAVANFGKKCLNVATETSNAWIGLNSILVGQGKSFEKAKSFINDYISDGLVPLNNAVTAYKNLAARGYSSEQIEKTMTALKNSATFGRQSTYSLGEAVQTASEGLKNENSILVDNAGVTKNVAKMWEDYAKSIGKTTNQLTQQEKIQAEVNGILEETKFQSNDAAKYTKTYSGVVGMLSQAFTTMKTAIGNVIQPLAKLFIPIITTAVNAVTRLFTALSSLLALFGLKADSVESISGGIEDIATNAENASSAISGAGNSAKKTAKQLNNLASFDNLNVLPQENDSSSGSSGGSTNNINVGDSTGAVNGVQENSALLNSINFQPLISAFNNLKSAAEPIINNVKNGLKWLYDNVLVPLGKWTIEGVLPAFLNLVSGALRVLNPLIEAFKPIFMWFWDNFLQPIASWTGGVIVSVLNTLADVLDKIGKWMSDNQSTVTNMEIAVLGFFGAWKGIELMSFIAQAGGVVSALTKITSAIWTCTGAKLADKLETIALTLMYAKDFVVSLASGTAALVKQAGQWVINTAMKVADTAATIASTVATTAATAATWLFNAALAVLTSPITLVVVAIGALIAIIVALVKNWDTVSAALSAGWEWIKQKAIEIFGAIGNFLKGLWEGIKNVAITIWNAIKTYFVTVFNIYKTIFTTVWNTLKTIITNAINGIKAIITTVFNAIKTVITNIFNGIKNTVTNIWNGIKNGIVNAVNSIKNGIVNAFQTAYNKITSIFRNIGSFFSGIWNNIKNTFSALGTKIGDAISGAVKSGINGVLGMIENIVNKFVNMINGAIDVINAIPGVNIGKLNRLNIPRLAEGGYVKANTPQLAMIGDNKHQGEVVAPEDKMLEMILTALKLFKEQDNSRDNQNQGNTITINFNGTLAQLIRVLKPELDRESNRKGNKLIIGGVT